MASFEAKFWEEPYLSLTRCKPRVLVCISGGVVDLFIGGGEPSEPCPMNPNITTADSKADKGVSIDGLLR